MRSTEENIELLSRTVLGEAREEADQILIDARENADAIRQRAKEQAELERARILERATQTAERIRGQAIATAQLKARTTLLESREKLLDSVFAAARQRLPSVKQRTDYDQIAEHLLREGLIQMKASRVEFRADETTMKYLTGSVLDKISKELKVQIHVGRPLEKGIGVIVDTDNGHMHFDNTLDIRLTQLKNILRAPVYHLIMGEQV
jgi:V/A-type H+-transporting ATPase subunit E